MEKIRSQGRNGGKALGMAFVAALYAVAVPAVAADTVKIYRSTMPDGSIVLSDKPSSGASSVATSTYLLTAPRGAAEAERDYWRRQSEAFNLRQQQREVQSQGRSRMSPRHHDDLASGDDGTQYFASYAGHADHKPLIPLRKVSPHYVSSPGAERGRSSGFIGSGFSTSR